LGKGQQETSDKSPCIPEGYGIVACGTLRGEMRRLVEMGILAVIVAYGEKCYFDPDTGTDTDRLLGRFGQTVRRVRAKTCVDMLASAEERSRLAEEAKVYWLTPGWLEHWDFIFKDWDPAKANETFPANDKAIVLDALGHFDRISQDDPEKILRICDWMRLPLEPRRVSLERLENLLRECARELAGSGA